MVPQDICLVKWQIKYLGRTSYDSFRMSLQGEENKGVELTGVRGTTGDGRGAFEGSDFRL